MSRPFAVFDIDGTVIRWQLYHALADELARRGHLDAAGFRHVRAARMTWKQRASAHSFADYEQQLIALIDQAMPGLSVVKFAAACEAVMHEYQDQAYTFTRDLIRQLRDQHYLLFAISASQDQIVRRFAEHYDFDDYGGSIYEIRDDAFTGKKTRLLKRDEKAVYLRGLIDKHGADGHRSVGVGDSDSDIPMLELVETPIAFNPNQELLAYAHAASWRIVIERKNVVYQLEPRDGHYVLA